MKKNFIKKLKYICEEFFYDIEYYFMDYIPRCYKTILNMTFKRFKLGFNPEDVYNLDRNIVEYILPRLKYLSTKIDCYPPELTERQWQREIAKMIAAFEMILNDKHSPYSRRRINKSTRIIEEGLDSFRKYFFSLWM